MQYVQQTNTNKLNSSISTLQTVNICRDIKQKSFFVAVSYNKWWKKLLEIITYSNS